MSNYTSLKASINANIKQNGNREITGLVLNSVLTAMVNTLGAGYQFAGIAVSDTNPGTPDAKVFYIANGKGAYTNFSGLDVTEDEVVVLYYDTEWHKVSTGIASQAKLSELQTIVDSKQDTISDLDDIREGAAKGATALQSETDPVYSADKPNIALKSELNGKQDTISDLDDIREGAELGKTALQEHQDISGLATKEEVATKQDKISDLATIREGAAKGATALQSYTETDPIYTADKPSIALKSELDGKQDKLTAGDNITIVDNVISATGGGGSVDLSAYAKTVDVNAGLATKQDKLIAGNGISIEQNVISATGGGGGGSVDLSAYAKTEEVNAGLATKQDIIPDLKTIREGAAKGATALQSESDPVYTADKPNIALKTDLIVKVDKEEGKGLSSNDYTNEEKAKLAGLENYDDTQIRTLIDGKQDVIPDLADIRSGASKGATALQSETDPIYSADKPSLALKTDIPDISGKADKTLVVTEMVGNSSYSIAPNRLTRLGTLASNVTLSLNTASEEAGVVNVYDIIFTTPATNAPSITWPEGITWVGGSAPAIAGGKTYEVSIMDNLATYGEY